MTGGRVTTDLPGSGVLRDGSALEPHHAAALVERINEELSRYPAPVRERLPVIHLVDRAETPSGRVHALFDRQRSLCILTPRLDLRGNVHRVVAAALLHHSPEHAAPLLELFQREGGGGAAGNATDLYPPSVLPAAAQPSAYVAAVMLNRRSLHGLALRSPEVGARVDASKKFLRAVGVTEQHLTALPPCPPYAYLSEFDGAYPVYSLRPEGTRVHLVPPTASGDHVYTPIAPSQESDALRQVLDDVWILPEGLVGSSVSDLHVVDDVSLPDCGIAGYASGSAGRASLLVIEVRGQRAIFSHEFGHAIHSRFRSTFPEEEWNSFVPPTAGYLGSGQEYIKSGLDERPFTPQLLDRGFITGYASASLNEDVAEMIEALLVGDLRLWSAATDAPLVAGKLACLLEFLHRVDPAFDRDYFEDIAHRRVREEGFRVQ